MINTTGKYECVKFWFKIVSKHVYGKSIAGSIQCDWTIKAISDFK